MINTDKGPFWITDGVELVNSFDTIEEAQIQADLISSAMQECGMTPEESEITIVQVQIIERVIHKKA